jgi:hypothetical protein
MRRAIVDNASWTMPSEQENLIPGASCTSSNARINAQRSDDVDCSLVPKERVTRRDALSQQRQLTSAIVWPHQPRKLAVEYCVNFFICSSINVYLDC